MTRTVDQYTQYKDYRRLAATCYGIFCKIAQNQCYRLA